MNFTQITNMKLIAACVLFLLCKNSFSQDYYMLVGTYNSPQSEGIYVYKFNSTDGSAVPVSNVKTSNPSFLAVSPKNKYVYAVYENAADNGKGGSVSSFSFDKTTGILKPISVQSSEGDHPCYVTIDSKDKWVLAANYTSGSLSVLPVTKKGKLSKAIQVVQHSGSGPDTTRQKSPHVHGVFYKPNSQYVYVTDLGIDKVMIYTQHKRKGKLSPGKTSFAATDAGSGPRHLDFHPNGKYVYLLNELTGSISVLQDKGDEGLSEIQNHSALPLTYKGKASSADIHISPDGKFLYVSNRGTSNSIGIFSINAATGMITLVDHQYTEGETPRNFNFDPTGNFLLVANQNSNSIVVFKRDIATGLLTDTGKRITVGKPVCIKWIPVN
jgi:6-phosphogluconolactonase